MIEFGKTLREAREAKGLSVSQVADATRIMHSIVEGLEAENFSGIPAPIYGRGVVKLYCEAVGLDPKPMVAEFMEIYNGNRDVAIKERPRAPEPVPEPAPEPVHHVEEPRQEPPQEPRRPVEEEPPADEEPSPAPEAEPPAAAPFSEPDLFAAPEPPPAPEPSPAPVPPAPEPPVLQEKPAQSLSRYATPVRQRPEYSVSPAFGRWAALALGAVVLLAFIVLGLRALYRATSPAPSDVDDATARATEAVAAAERRETEAPKGEAPKGEAQKGEAAEQRPEAAARRERTPQDVPSLYID